MEWEVLQKEAALLGIYPAMIDDAHYPTSVPGLVHNNKCFYTARWAPLATGVSTRISWSQWEHEVLALKEPAHLLVSLSIYAITFAIS